QEAQYMRAVLNLFKLRIGIVITWTALAAVAVTPGPALTAWQITVLALCVLIASASAGAFNQFVERDIDARMQRTRNRPFVTGALAHAQRWVWVIMALVATSVLAAAYTLNPLSALYVFLGAFFYAVVYTVWLKRRTWLNIVIGGFSGSFAVLAGAAAVTPAELPPEPLILAIVLFLWTPSHFWSLAMAYREDYVAAGVPMLPAVIGNVRTAKVIFGNTVALVVVSLLPVFYGAGWIYLGGAAIGGGWFLWKSYLLMHNPYRREAMRSFFASLAQLALLLSAAMIETAVLR
ncbi:MAG: heme o synthase, partial [Burkholderiales bacterium]